MDDPTRQHRLEMLWQHVTNVIKRVQVNPTLWSAMEAAKPLTADENLLVLALMPQDFHLASLLEKPGTRATIEEQLSHAARTEIHYRVIEGETVADWAEIKEGERIAREQAKMPTRHYFVPKHQPPPPPTAEELKSWDNLINYCHRIFLTLHARSSCQTRALYIMDMVPFIAMAEDTLVVGPGSGERSLLHALEKVAQMADVDPILIAIEYYRYRGYRNPGASATETES